MTIISKNERRTIEMNINKRIKDYLPEKNKYYSTDK